MRFLEVDNYIINTPLLKIVLDLKSSLTNGKLKSVEEKKDNILVTCPHHSDGLEKEAAGNIYIGDDKDIPYGYYRCWVCDFEGSFVNFIAECLEVDYNTAKKWLTTRYGEQKEEEHIQLEPILLDKPKIKTKYLDESILDKFFSWHPYMDKRHLTRKVCETFKVGYDPKTECLTFPVYDEYNKLYMLTRRSVNNKTFIIDKDKEKPVYLMYFIIKNKLKEVTVMESQINALQGWCWSIPSVATFGCNITDKQIDIFNKSGVNHIYLCFDGDNAGRHGTKKFIEQISKDIIVDVIVMDEGKDVNDITQERFKQLPILSSAEWLRLYGKNC